MGGTTSQNKGKRGEREVVKLLQPVVNAAYEQAKENGYGEVAGEAPVLQRNTLQSDRGGFDIVGLQWLALEVKFQESLSIGTWWKQCLRQAGAGQEPVLMYRQSRKPWRVRMKGWVGETVACPWAGVVDVDLETFQWYAYHRTLQELMA